LEATFIEYFAVLIKKELLFYSTVFKKKTQKIPKREIEQAVKLMNEYLKYNK